VSLKTQKRGAVLILYIDSIGAGRGGAVFYRVAVGGGAVARQTTAGSYRNTGRRWL